MLGSCLVWIAVLRVLLSLRERPEAARRTLPGPAAPRRPRVSGRDRPHPRSGVGRRSSPYTPPRVPRRDQPRHPLRVRRDHAPSRDPVAEHPRPAPCRKPRAPRRGARAGPVPRWRRGSCRRGPAPGSPRGRRRAPVRPGRRPVGVHVREDPGEVGRVPVVRLAVQQDEVGAEARRGAGEVGEQDGSVRSMRRPGSPRPACSWRGRPEATAIHSRCRSRTGSAQRAADPAAAPASAPAAPRTSPGPGGSGARAETVPCARAGGEGHGVRGGAVHGLGEVGEEGLDGARRCRRPARRAVPAGRSRGPRRRRVEASSSGPVRSPGSPVSTRYVRDARCRAAAAGAASSAPSSRRRAR